MISLIKLKTARQYKWAYYISKGFFIFILVALALGFLYLYVTLPNTPLRDIDVQAVQELTVRDFVAGMIGYMFVYFWIGYIITSSMLKYKQEWKEHEKKEKHDCEICGFAA